MSVSRERAAVASPEAAEPIAGVRIGWIAGVDPRRGVLVDFPGNPGGAVPARSIVPMDEKVTEAAVKSRQGAVLQFEDGNPALPVLMGLLQATSPTPLLDALLSAPPETAPKVAHVDGKRVVIEGKDEIVLRCGEASITLRRDGKLLLRGTYLETRASGTHRIKGASVQIN